MPLTQEEKERIMEEEAVRLEGRLRANAAMGAKATGSHRWHGGSCEHCSHQPDCRGCRVWAWVFAVVLVVGLLHFLYGHDGRYGWGYGERGRMGWSEPREQAAPPADGATPPAQKP